MPAPSPVAHPFPALAAVLGVLLGVSGVASATKAAPSLDLQGYPALPAGQTRWVIQLPAMVPPSSDPSLAAEPAGVRVQLIAGKELEVDCNQHRFGGRWRAEAIPTLGTTIYRITEVGPMVSTRRACPPDERRRRSFVVMGSQPFVVPYSSSRPIVIDAPSDLQLRWRLWRAERDLRPARAL